MKKIVFILFFGFLVILLSSLIPAGERWAAGGGCFPGGCLGGAVPVKTYGFPIETSVVNLLSDDFIKSVSIVGLLLDWIFWSILAYVFYVVFGRLVVKNKKSKA